MHKSQSSSSQCASWSTDSSRASPNQITWGRTSPLHDAFEHLQVYNEKNDMVAISRGYNIYSKMNTKMGLCIWDLEQRVHDIVNIIRKLNVLRCISSILYNYLLLLLGYTAFALLKIRAYEASQTCADYLGRSFSGILAAGVSGSGRNESKNEIKDRKSVV